MVQTHQQRGPIVTITEEQGRAHHLGQFPGHSEKYSSQGELSRLPTVTVRAAIVPTHPLILQCSHILGIIIQLLICILAKILCLLIQSSIVSLFSRIRPFCNPQRYHNTNFAVLCRVYQLYDHLDPTHTLEVFSRLAKSGTLQVGGVEVRGSELGKSRCEG